MSESLPIQQVRIGGIDYKVVYRDEIRNKDDVLLYGDITYEKARIRLALAPTQVQLAVLIHEAMHGILHHAGIHEHDEKTIDVLSNGIYQVLADNADLLAALTTKRFARE